jgi:hypothetical protein
MATELKSSRMAVRRAICIIFFTSGELIWDQAKRITGMRSRSPCQHAPRTGSDDRLGRLAALLNSSLTESLRLMYISIVLEI